jgi:crotonobetainyl-CoA:carnitine CoA-transferase CaiB-like acyl-CoA transferase
MKQMTQEQALRSAQQARDELVAQITRYKLPVRFVATMLDVSPPTVHSWMSGTSLPTSFQAVTNALRFRQYMTALDSEVAWKLAAHSAEGKKAREGVAKQFIGPA